MPNVSAGESNRENAFCAGDARKCTRRKSCDWPGASTYQ